MEILGLVEVPTCLVWITTVIILPTVVYTNWKRRTFTRLGIPTKPSPFFFGDIGKKGMTFLPSMVKKYGKVFGSFQANIPILIVTDTEMMKQILVKDFSNYQERMNFRAEGFEMALTRASGEHWLFLRSTLSPCFTTGKIKKMNVNISTCLERLHSIIQKQIQEHPEGFDIYGLLGAYSMDVICSAGFGMDVASQGDPNNLYITNAKKFAAGQYKGDLWMMLGAFYPDLPGIKKKMVYKPPKDPVAFFKDASRALVEERKKAGLANPDLLQTMLNAHHEDQTEVNPEERKTQTMTEMKQRGLTDHEVVMNSFELIIAGYATTAATLAWLLYDLALNPKCQDKLIGIIDKDLGEHAPNYDSVFALQYLDMVVNESMRFHPVGSGISRTGKEDRVICGVTIPKDMIIYMPALALHFMPEYWEEPTEFRPERFSAENKHKLNEYAYIPFGLGRRNCIGMRLALLNVKMTIVSLLQKYRFEKTERLQVPLPDAGRGLHKPGKPVILKVVARQD